VVGDTFLDDAPPNAADHQPPILEDDIELAVVHPTDLDQYDQTIFQFKYVCWWPPDMELVHDHPPPRAWLAL
jgi:hypothetical protein